MSARAQMCPIDSLEGDALNYAVAIAANHGPDVARFTPSTDWAQGGPLIEQENISLDQRKGEPCRAFMGTPVHHTFTMFAPHGQPLVAAMRCFVASKLGDEVAIPDGLQMSAACALAKAGVQP